ncbi:MAG TPA: DEAD/DEAH box helicase family protein [Saprospiraceae bacterium]|nr:DEAD/DEAH box helicase family protein [Saprospiraceae bacterium]HNT20559.1 DEAD/DEAH box helicase family protein [Saprospiraceae bacterium]
MNEAETRAELIDPKLKGCGWGVVEGSKILREYYITAGRIQTGGIRAKRLKVDYVLVYKGLKLAIVEAKSDELEVGEAVAQAKQYALKMDLETTYATNGKSIYSISLKTGVEGLVDNYLSPEELWNKTFANQNLWREKFASIPFEDRSGTWHLRYYQEIAINNTLEAIANKQNRILLTLATGTGKTAIAFQIAWKLFHARWNLKYDGSRRPRILFLADRNILADQAYNAFSAFPEDALVRIKPDAIRKRGAVPTNGSIFFTIFQTFMSGTDSEGKSAPYFGDYPPDYFDFIVIDECHRGGANDEGNWRAIMEYFSPAVQLGLTATPKRLDNADTYKYFGDPVFIYSLKEGINDGYLTPFKVKRIKTTLDDYIYTSDDQIVEGEIEQDKLYTEPDFNKKIEILEREAKRVKIYLDEVNQSEKTLIFCATQEHAAIIRDLVNQYKKSKDPNYCVRVTANDGEIGDQFLREFQDNEKTIPTVLTTSQKLSTGVDARNIRNIVLLRPVNSMIEFKQIVGRGTRLFDGKEFFTIYDFVDAYHHFADPEWDGEPVEPDVPKRQGIGEENPPKDLHEPEEEEVKRELPQKIKIKLKDGKEREIQHMISTSFLSSDGKPISVEEFLQNLFGSLPEFFKSEEELRTLWSNPLTRRTLLEKLDEAGFGKEELTTLQKLIDAEKSDLFDVLEYVFNSDFKPITREARVLAAQATIFALLNDRQKEFIEFVLSKYVETGVEELDQDKLPVLLTSKYQSLPDAGGKLGDLTKVKDLFIGFQKFLYERRVG